MAFHKWDNWAKSVISILKENKLSQKNTFGQSINQDATINFIKDERKNRWKSDKIDKMSSWKLINLFIKK